MYTCVIFEWSYFQYFPLSQHKRTQTVFCIADAAACCHPVRISRAGCEPATRLCSSQGGHQGCWTFRWSKGRPKSAICFLLASRLPSRYDAIDLQHEYDKHHELKCKHTSLGPWARIEFQIHTLNKQDCTELPSVKFSFKQTLPGAMTLA